MKSKNILLAVIIVVLLNATVTNIIYAFQHPDKTETQQFLHLPKSFVWNFE